MRTFMSYKLATATRTLEDNKVVISAAVEPEQRAELERLARAGERTLSQEIRRAVREHLERCGIAEPPGAIDEGEQ